MFRVLIVYSREEADQLHEQHQEMQSIIEEQSRKIKSLEKSIQLKDLSLAEADLKIQVNHVRNVRCDTVGENKICSRLRI